jgi:hypothetical protein
MARNNFKFFYSHRERTLKQRTVHNAVENAKKRLEYDGIPLCTNALRGRNITDPLTIEEVNNLCEELVQDSYHYSYINTTSLG